MGGQRVALGEVWVDREEEKKQVNNFNFQGVGSLFAGNSMVA